MSSTTQPTATVRARVDRRGRISLIWLIPLITALIGGWIGWDTLAKRGPTITITFQSGEGLQAGQSRVKHKDVDLGLVTAVRLSDDASHVAVTVEMKRSAARFLTQGARFWVVTPRLFAGSISGLDTLISGSYIELLPAATAGPAERQFTGLEDPPVLTENVPGRTFLLHADRIGSVSVGSPVFFRGLNVGTVLGWDVGDMVKDVTIHAFVRAPYDQYVHNESRFWNASGVSVRLGAQGIKVQLDSVKALLLGGIAFDTPTPALQTPISTANSAFTLYADEQAANNAAYRRRIPLVGYFTGSVAGLAVGSPVTFRGLRIGEVTAIDLKFDPKTNLLQTPIHFEIEPERFGNFQLAQKRGILVNASFLVQHGMRAQLQSGNLLTGQMELALAFIPDAKPAELQTEDGLIVVPTVPGQFADLSASVNALLAKLNQMPFEQIGQNLNALLAGATSLTTGPQIKDAMQSLTTTLAATDALMKQLDAGTKPALKRLPEIAASLQAMLANTNKLVASTDAGYGDNSRFHRDLNRAMGQLTDMMQSLRELADLLTRHPEALIRGRTDTGVQ